MSKKHKKLCRALYYIDHSLIAISIITGWVSILASLAGIPIVITSSAIGLKIYVIMVGIKKFKSIIKKKKQRSTIK